MIHYSGNIFVTGKQKSSTEAGEISELMGYISKFHNKKPPKQISKSDRRLITNKKLRKKIINKAYDRVPWLA